MGSISCPLYPLYKLVLVDARWVSFLNPGPSCCFLLVQAAELDLVADIHAWLAVRKALEPPLVDRLVAHGIGSYTGVEMLPRRHRLLD